MSQDYLDASKFGRDVTARGKEFESAMEMLGIPREKWDFMKENIFHFGPKEGWGIERESDKPKYADVADYVRQEGSTLGLFGAVAGKPVPDPDDPNKMVYLFNKGDTAAKENVKKLPKESISTMGGTDDVLLRGIPGKGMNEKWQNMMGQIDRAVDVIWEQGKIEVASVSGDPRKDKEAELEKRAANVNRQYGILKKSVPAERLKEIENVIKKRANDLAWDADLGDFAKVLELNGMDEIIRLGKGFLSDRDLNNYVTLVKRYEELLASYGNKPIGGGSSPESSVKSTIDRYRSGSAYKSPYGN
jgi:hypothetical protein